MRDALRTGLALICLTIAISLALVFGLAYARNEGWLDLNDERSLFIGSSDDDTTRETSDDR
jgi:hypothetical protein